jgi:hypothetical protein
VLVLVLGTLERVATGARPTGIVSVPEYEYEYEYELGRR